MFLVAELTEGKNWIPFNPCPDDDDDNELTVFETAAEAVDAAKYWTNWLANAAEQYRLRGGKPRKLQVRPVPPSSSVDWRAREAARFASGEYQPAPWHNHPEAPEFHASAADHFVHLSTERPGWVAYTADDNAGVLDRQRRCSVSTYLVRHAVDCTDDVGDYWQGLAEGVDMSAYKLHISGEREDFARVYVEGPDSCMGGDDHEDFELEDGVHPAEVYAAGDLQIAWLTKGEKDTPVARCLIRPSNMHRCRMYSDGIEEPAAVLRRLLFKAGYRDRKEGLDGVKLLRIKTYKSYVMPYIDGGYYAGKSDDGKHWVLSREKGEYGTQGTVGYIEQIGQGAESRRSCEACGDGLDGDDCHYPDDNTGPYCASCYEDSYVECERTGDMVHADDTITMGNGETWCQRAVDRHGRRCELTSDWWPRSEMVRVVAGDDGPQWWCCEAFEEHGFVCGVTGINYPRSQGVEYPWGWAHRDYVAALNRDVRTGAPIDPNYCGPALVELPVTDDEHCLFVTVGLFKTAVETFWSFLTTTTTAKEQN